MKTIRLRKRGFTIAEIIISIAVISVALLGTIAAIAFGLRASRLGADNTTAIQVNRKIFEMVLQGLYSQSHPLFLHDPEDPNAARGSGNWKPVYSENTPGWFTLQDYGFKPGTAEAELFKRDVAGTELDVSSPNPPAAGTSLKVNSRFRRIVVQTRWQTKQGSGWKVVRTEALSSPEAN